MVPVLSSLAEKRGVTVGCLQCMEGRQRIQVGSTTDPLCLLLFINAAC